MQRINQEVGQLLGEERMQRLAVLARLRRNWASMLGPMLAAVSEPEEAQLQADGSIHLIIAVNHSMVAQQVLFLRQEIRQACSNHCRVERIAKVFTRVRPYAGVTPTQEPRPQPSPVSLMQKKRIAVELRNIPNKAVRLAMFQAQVAQLMWWSEEAVRE
jgi:hypothetical protein